MTDRSQDLSPEEQRAVVLEQLARREAIVAATRELLDARERSQSLDPLAGVSDDVRREAEDEYYRAQGRQRYETRDGRSLFLTPEELAARKSARSDSRRRRRRRRAHGATTPVADRSPLRTWSFYGLLVLLALALAWLLLH